ncbi:MAG: hypothetical protein ACI9VR_004495 [Cognaticolwellia sp.]|jgi:hypothetical protein
MFLMFLARALFASQLFALLACAARPDPVPVPEAPPVWRFELATDYRTQGVDSEGEPIAALVPFAQQQEWLRGSLSRSYARRYPDDSQGWVVRFGLVETAPTPEGPWTRNELSGKTVELRGFDNGEVLALGGAEHLAGAPRYGEVLDFVFVAISPTVPDLKVGESGWRRQNWPFLVAKRRRMHSTLHAEWTAVERSPQRAVMDYQGRLEGRGLDTPAQASMTLSGQAQGQVVMRVGDASMEKHTLDWTRVMAIDYQGTGAQITQTQHVVGSFLRSESLGTPGSVATRAAELDLYLTTPEVHALMMAQMGRFEQCYADSGASGRVTVGEVFVNFTIAPNGKAQGATIHVSKSGLEALDDCLLTQANTLEFRAHDEEPMQVGYPFVFMDAVLQPYPMIFVQERPIELLWLHLPPDPAIRRALLGN